MGVELELAYDDMEEIGMLFTEYTAMLVERDPIMAVSLRLQNYDVELAHLRDKYGTPDGRLYLARVDGKAAGCVAIRRFDAAQCELKRMYVRPSYRGHRVATALLDQVLADARAIGYKAMLLDTLPVLQEAIGLYKKEGFQEVQPYYYTPVTTTIFMKKDLL